MNRHFDKALEAVRVTIYPGEMFATRHGEVIYTVLGSCVSVCMYDSKSHIGGMNHFMLAERFESRVPEFDREPGRFGKEALQLLLDKMTGEGAVREKITAKVIGGASMISACCRKNCVSKANASIARDFLVANKIPILLSDTGGERGRKVYFDTSTGSVGVRSLQNQRLESCSVVLSEESRDEECCKRRRVVMGPP